MRGRKLTLYFVQCGVWEPEVFTSEKEAAREVGEYIDYVYDQLGELYEDERTSAQKAFEQCRSTKNSWVGIWNSNVHAGYYIKEVFISPLNLMES